MGITRHYSGIAGYYGDTTGIPYKYFSVLQGYCSGITGNATRITITREDYRVTMGIL